MSVDTTSCLKYSLRKQPAFRDVHATSSFPANERRLWNEGRNFILMTCNYPDLGSAFDWLKKISPVAGPIGSTTQIWTVACHQHGICARRSSNVISMALRNTCWVFSQTSTNANGNLISKKLTNFHTCLMYKMRKNLNCEIQLCRIFVSASYRLRFTWLNFFNPSTGMELIRATQILCRCKPTRLIRQNDLL